MKRNNFILGIPKTEVLQEPIQNHQIRVYLNGKKMGGVVALKTEVDLAYGYIKAYVKRWSGAALSDGSMGTADAVNEIIMGKSNYNVTLDQSGRFQYEELNPNMEMDSLVVESIVDKGKYMDFYLRTMKE